MKINQTQRDKALRVLSELWQVKRDEVCARHKEVTSKLSTKEVTAGLRAGKFKLRKRRIDRYTSIYQAFDLKEPREKNLNKARDAELGLLLTVYHDANMLILLRDVDGDDVAEALTEFRNWKPKKS